MSVKALDTVFDHSHADGAAFIVLVAMADWADHQGRCYPSFAQIAKKARVSRASVAVAIRRLIALGEIERVSHGHRPLSADENDDPIAVRAQWRNVYRIVLRRPREVVQPLDQQEGSSDVVQSLDHLSTAREVVQSLDQHSAASVVQQPDHLSAALVVQSSDHLTLQVVQPVDQPADDVDSTGGPIEQGGVVQSSASRIRNKPSVRPSEELKAGAAPRPAHDEHEDPNDNLAVISKLAHEAIDVLGLYEFADLKDRIKARCAELSILYDANVVTKALESAIWQRKYRRRDVIA